MKTTRILASLALLAALGSAACTKTIEPKKPPLAPDPTRVGRNSHPRPRPLEPALILVTERREIQVRSWSELRAQPFVFRVDGAEAQGAKLELTESTCPGAFGLRGFEVVVMTDSAPSGTTSCEVKVVAKSPSGASDSLIFKATVLPPALGLGTHVDTQRGVLTSEMGKFEFWADGPGAATAVLEVVRSTCGRAFVPEKLTLVPSRQPEDRVLGPQSCAFTVAATSEGKRSNEITVRLDLAAPEELSLVLDSPSLRVYRWEDFRDISVSVKGFHREKTTIHHQSTCPDLVKYEDGFIRRVMTSGDVAVDKTCAVTLEATNDLSMKAEPQRFELLLTPPPKLIVETEPAGTSGLIRLGEMRAVRILVRGEGATQAQVTLESAEPADLCKGLFAVEDRLLRVTEAGQTVYGPGTCKLLLKAVSGTLSGTGEHVVTLGKPPAISLEAEPGSETIQSVSPQTKPFRAVRFLAGGYGTPLVLSLEVQEEDCRPLFLLQEALLSRATSVFPGERTCHLKVVATDTLGRPAAVPVVVSFLQSLEVEASDADQTVSAASEFKPMKLNARDAIDPTKVSFALRPGADSACASFFILDNDVVRINSAQVGSDGIECSASVVAKEGSKTSDAKGIHVRIPSPGQPFVIRLAESSVTAKAGSAPFTVDFDVQGAPGGGDGLAFERLGGYADPCVQRGIFEILYGETAVRIRIPADFTPRDCDLTFRAVKGTARSETVTLRLAVGEREKTFSDYCNDASQSEEMKALVNRIRAHVGRVTRELETPSCDKVSNVLSSSSTWRTLRLQGFSLRDMRLLQFLSATRHLDLTSNLLVGFTLPGEWRSLESLRLSGNGELSTLSVPNPDNGLKALFLDGTKIRDLGFLANLKELETLDLSGTDVLSLEPLKGLPKLRHLYLNKVRLTPERLDVVRQLTNLKSLGLRKSHLGDARPLVGLSQLTLLNLEHNALTDLAPLTSLTGLRSLLLAGNPAVPARFESLTSLKVLSLPAGHSCPPSLSVGPVGSENFCSFK